MFHGYGFPAGRDVAVSPDNSMFVLEIRRMQSSIIFLAQGTQSLPLVKQKHSVYHRGYHAFNIQVQLLCQCRMSRYNLLSIAEVGCPYKISHSVTCGMKTSVTRVRRFPAFLVVQMLTQNRKRSRLSLEVPTIPVTECRVPTCKTLRSWLGSFV